MAGKVKSRGFISLLFFPMSLHYPLGQREELPIPKKHFPISTSDSKILKEYKYHTIRFYYKCFKELRHIWAPFQTIKNKQLSQLRYSYR